MLTSPLLDTSKMELEAFKSVFQYEEDFVVTEEVQKGFDENGYVVLRGLLDKDEVSKLVNALESDQGVMSKAYSRDDGMGKAAKVALWNHPGNDITGIVARSEKVAGTMEKLLGGEVYHYHTKVILKDARTGGAWIWHQDYGYWYYNGCIYPNLGTVWIALEKSDQENGCVQFLSGSHKVGRIDHAKEGEQAGADPERVEHCRRSCPLRYAEMNAGDALFFHSNLLHCSAQNNSDRRRWAFLVAFNRADNNPVKKLYFPCYTPLKKVPNSAIKDCPAVFDLAGKDFYGCEKSEFSLFSELPSNEES